MDTEWFAVDAEGNVGLFNSSEDGAVPLRAATLGGASEASFDAAVYHATLAVRAVAADAWRGDDRGWLAEAKPTRVLVVAGAAVAGDFIEVATAPLWAGVSRGPVAPAPLAALPGVLAVVPTSDLDELGHEAPVFVFTREHGDDPGLYGVASAPAKPLRVDELPPAIRDEVGSLKLATTFSEGAPVHLGDHLKDDEAGYWGSDWTLRGFGDPAAKPPVATIHPRRTSWTALAVIALIVAVLVLIRLLK